jgi:hypothetical protein
VSVILGISVGELTVQAAWVAALAILAVTLAGWRKPARAAPLTPRAANDSPSLGEEESESGSTADDGRDHESEPIAVAITPVPLEHAPTVARRLVAGAAAAGLSVLTGTVLAILISFAAVVAVVWATNLLGR